MSAVSNRSDLHDVRYQVLVVEDNPAHAELISRLFESQEHFQIMIANTLCDARTYLTEISPDLIITDFRLPDGNGADLVIQFKKETDCPVILMTSFGDETIAVNAMKAGAADYIVKSDKTLNQLPNIAIRVLREWRLILDKKVALDQQYRLTTILEATPDLICIADIDGFLTYLNKAGHQMLGLTEGEELGKIRLSDFHSPEDTELITAQGIPYAIEHGMWKHETTFMSKSNEKVLTSQVLITHKSSRGEIEFFSTVAKDIRYIRSAEEKINYLAYYDALTDLPNRNELLKRLDHEIGKVQRQNIQSALLFIDLDNFKYVNDSLGHPTGDLVLKEMAIRLKSVIRAEDMLARLGGDEFVVILSGLSTDSLEAINKARDVSRKLNALIAADIHAGNMVFNLTASIGISMFSSEKTSGPDLLRYADAAMYKAKKSGKNQFEVFHHDMGEDVSRLLELEHRLRQATQNREFILFYQPIFNSDSGKIRGAEALLRWNDPVNGITEPAMFLDTLESSGLIAEVGDWVLEASFTQLAGWLAQGLWDPQHRLSINISARQFNSAAFSQNVLRLLEKTKAPAQCIDIEVTEHSVISDMLSAIAKMEELIARGITFSLDDFGTGYSSLGYLKSLPFATLKIDKSFICDIIEDESDKALVTSIIAIAKNLGLSVVAEGIETEQQMLTLRDLNCEFFQGHYFSKPVPVDEFEESLQPRDQN